MRLAERVAGETVVTGQVWVKPLGADPTTPFAVAFLNRISVDDDAGSGDNNTNVTLTLRSVGVVGDGVIVVVGVVFVFVSLGVVALFGRAHNRSWSTVLRVLLACLCTDHARNANCGASFLCHTSSSSSSSSSYYYYLRPPAAVNKCKHFRWSDLGVANETEFAVLDVWNDATSIGTFNSALTVEVPKASARMFTLVKNNKKD